MSVNLSPLGGAGAQFFDNNGVMLSGGLVYTYAAGTTTPLAAYTSNTGNTALANPIVLDASGRVPTGQIWLTYGQGYKFTVKTSTGTLIGTYDNIPTAALPPLVNDAVSIAYEQGASVTAGNFIIGQTYLITFIGSTNFQSVGAVSNTVGTYFIATGVGSGTGTAQISRTVEAKLRETVSVTDFGAVGNGVTDDTAAIQAAINSGAVEIYFPNGTYLVSSILISAACKLYGPSTLQKNTVTGTSIFKIQSNDVEIDGLTFNGASVDTLIPSTSFTDNAILVNGTSTPNQYSNIKISNCTVNGVAGFGIRIEYATNVQLQNNTISYCGYAGILCTSISNGIINNNIISYINSAAGAVNWYGISVTRDPSLTTTNSARPTDCIITNNVVSYVSQWTGIDIHAGLRIIVDSNQISYCKNGIYAQYDSTSATYKQPSENIVFSNNIIQGNVTAATSSLGIASLGDPTMPNIDITIIGNQVINGGGLSSSIGGIFITETKNCLVSNNISKNSWRSGFSINGACDSVVFENNEINGVQPDGTGSSTYYGYVVGTTMTNVVIQNNRFYNNSGTSGNTPTYGILYSAGTYSGVAFSKNRILNLATTSFLYNGSNANRYQDFIFNLEPTSVYDAGWTLTSGNTTETRNVTVRRNVYGTIATNSLVYAVDRTTVTLPKVFVRTTTQVDPNIYTVTAFTTDGTTFGSATNIPIMLTVNGVCWTD